MAEAADPVSLDPAADLPRARGNLFLVRRALGHIKANALWGISERPDDANGTPSVSVSTHRDGD